jgi:hypothetical protein
LQVTEPTMTATGRVCGPWPMDVSVFERALIAYARAFPVRKGKLRVIDRFWRAAAGGRRIEDAVRPGRGSAKAVLLLWHLFLGRANP